MDEGTGGTGGDRPPADYRFLLANERTFLAYVRTALAFQVAGLGVLQFLTHAQGAVRELLGVGLVLLGSALGVVAYTRSRANERAIRSGTEMTPPRVATVVALAVACIPLLAALALALA